MTGQWGEPSSGPSFKIGLNVDGLDSGSVRVVKSVWYCKHIDIAFVTVISAWERQQHV